LLQNALMRTISPQMLLSLNVRNVNELFPGFSIGDFAVVHGSASVGFLTSLLCVRAQFPPQVGGLGSSVVFIDGGNTFRLYRVARLAQLHQLDPQRALERIYISRAFTAYQMTDLITEKLKAIIKKSNAKLVIISDLAGMFLDKNIQDEEARSIYRQVTAYLSNFAKENQLVLIATCPPHQDIPRNELLQATTCEKANVIIALKQSKHKREFILEKHHNLPLGTVEFPLENLTLADFTAA
jgi:hypothetical protein